MLLTFLFAGSIQAMIDAPILPYGDPESDAIADRRIPVPPGRRPMMVADEEGAVFRSRDGLPADDRLIDGGEYPTRGLTGGPTETRRFTLPEPILRSIEKGAVRADVTRIAEILRQEMNGLSPEALDKIESSVQSNTIDRSRFRDVFVIKKRTVTDGNRKIITFDIKEQVFPKSEYSYIKDPYTKVLFWVTLLLLLTLVFTTTHQMCQVLASRGCSVKLRRAQEDCQ